MVDLKNVRAKLVARSVVDESGARVFDDADVLKLSDKSAAGLQRVFEVAQRLSGLSDEDVDELVKPTDDNENEGSEATTPAESVS